MEICLISPTPDTTKGIGRAIGKALRGGEIICLYGEIGSGKTCLTQGIAEGLEVQDTKAVKSPSFILVREYKGILPLYHIDLFRLQRPLELEDLGYEEYLYGEGVAVIEWADRMGPYLPSQRIDITINFGRDHQREIRIRGPRELIERLKSYTQE